jgi:hypothetical protein
MMSFEVESDSALKREWVAVADTTIKASPALASTLARHEKMLVAKGTHVIAMMTSEDQAHWTISHGMWGDVPLQEGLCFLYKRHWELQPKVVAETPVPEEVDPALEVVVHDKSTLHTVPETAESVDLSPAPQPPAIIGPSFEPKVQPASSKPISHRRLFALFKREAKRTK